MSGAVLLTVGIIGGALFLHSLTPPEPPKPVVNIARTIEGARDVNDTVSVLDYQPPTGYSADVDSQTGLPFVWVYKPNGTRSRFFTNASGVPVTPLSNN